MRHAELCAPQCVSYDVKAVKAFLAALRAAAVQRGVAPSALWSALDALERN